VIGTLAVALLIVGLLNASVTIASISARRFLQTFFFLGVFRKLSSIMTTNEADVNKISAAE
jgi:uncharacterized membrane protein YiaA